MAWLDMHVHSCYSDDGQYTPKELMKICIREGVHTVAIADHNTAKGISEGKQQAELLGITLIPAIELDCTFQEVNLHVLGYWIDETYAEFEKVEQEIWLQEQQAAYKRMELICQLGIYVNKEELLQLKQGIVTGEMIAEAALAEQQNNRNPLLEPYRKGGARSDNPFVQFYWDYCAQGKPAYVPIQYLSLEEAVNLIHKAGGVAVLAHPGNNIKEKEELLFQIMQTGVDGIEVFSSYHSEEQTAFYLNQASKLGVGMSCGSDFHGNTKPRIQIGCVNFNDFEKSLDLEFTPRRMIYYMERK